jgi:hypothetical protein
MQHVRLDNFEDLMTQNSLIWSTVCTRSKKSGSNVIKMSTPSINSMDTIKSSNRLDIILSTATMHLYQVQTLKDIDKVLKNKMRILQISLKGTQSF